MRAAIYARFSSDLQNERSIDDQIALCRTYADREGLTVSEVFEDRARSAASMFGRPGLAEMMDAVKARRIDVVIVEALDRLSRDQEDLSGIWKRAKFAGVEIRAVHDGKADAIQIGLRGLVGALYLTDLAHKIRRASAGQVRDGKLPGGRSYGYVPTPGAPGERAIDEGEAEVIRRIYRDYLAGHVPRAIAGALNREGIAPPRGTRWNASTINGSRQRGNGILHNELYRGEIVWNRIRMIKDPDTGKRVSRLNPEAEWVRKRVPALAIVDDATFEAVQARTAGRKPMDPASRQPRHLLSGLLRCGACGGGMSNRGRDKTGKTRLHCSTYHESRTCTHTRIYYAEKIEELVLDGLRAQLQDPQRIERFVAVYREERDKLAKAAAQDRGRLTTRLGEVTRTLNRLVDAIADGSMSAKTIGGRINDLEAEQATIEAELARSDTSAEVIALHPQAIRRYLDQIDSLRQALASSRGSNVEPGSPAAAMRALILAVVVHPTERKGPVDIEIRGRLADLLKTADLPPQARLSGGSMVAADGFEPPTKGL